LPAALGGSIVFGKQNPKMHFDPLGWELAGFFSQRIYHSMAEKTAFFDRLVAANRVLVDLDAIDEFRSLSLTTGHAIREAQQVLADLLEQKTDDLTPDQAKFLENVIDRLRARLKFFERPV
jgi:hypothetical protein